jgi:GNAT superfamily N-acetyltransferase
MQIVYRPARADELQTAQELVVQSINDLTMRHGFGPMASLRPADFQQFSLKDDPGGLWVAEVSGEIVGFAFSWISGTFWFLAELFVSPNHQGQGIGDGLLKRTFDHANRAGAANKALITFTFNTVSQGLYIRRGLYPRLPIYFFTVARDTLPKQHHAELLRHSGIEDTAPDQARLAGFDLATLGFTRDKHHRFLLGDPKMRGVFFHAGQDCVGYAYLNSGGHVGPLAVVRPDMMSQAFATALNLAAESGASKHLGLSSRRERRGAGRGRQPRDANDVSHGAGIVARIWRLWPLSATQSRLFVMERRGPCAQATGRCFPRMG